MRKVLEDKTNKFIAQGEPEINYSIHRVKVKLGKSKVFNSKKIISVSDGHMNMIKYS